ncbi:hypothetical protein GCM10027517_05370 [Phycicoccus ginsengisoli]
MRRVRLRWPRVHRTVWAIRPTGDPGASGVRAVPDHGTVEDSRRERRHRHGKDGPVSMWHRILDRIAPVMAEDVSELDRRDGVGAPRPDHPAARVSSPSESSRS